MRPDLFDYLQPVCDERDELLYYDAGENSDHTALTANWGYPHLCKILTELGHDDWREGQLPAITALVEGHDAFVTLPPGSGKSVIYQACGISFVWRMSHIHPSL